MSTDAYLGQSTDLVLGQEFLTWLWFRSENNNSFDVIDSDGKSGGTYMLSVGQRMVVQGGEGEERETASISGAFSPLREARLGLATGKKVTRALITLDKAGEQWQLTLKAEDFSIGALKTPTVDKNDKEDDPDALFFEKIYLIEAGIDAVDHIYKYFLGLRLSKEWIEESAEIRTWIKARPAV